MNYEETYTNMRFHIPRHQRSAASACLLSILVSLALTCASEAQTQNIPADDVANALDSLKQQAIAKIDQDLDANARAFADAKNYSVSIFWSDLFSPFLDIARAVYSGLTAIPTKSPNSVRAWVKSSLEATEVAKKIFSFGTCFDRLRQDGQNLELAIFGPAYSSNVESMLDRAEVSGCPVLCVIFDYDSYRISIQNDLNGISGLSPLGIVHKSSKADRTGGETLPSVHAAKNYIFDQMRILSTEMRQQQLPSSRISEIKAFIEARRRDLQNSMSGNSRVSYSAYLTKNSTSLLCPVSFSLGSISSLQQWHWTMQAAYAANLDIEYRVRLQETADVALSVAAGLLTEEINLNLSVEAVVAGQSEANEILKNATSLGASFAKADVGELFNIARTNASNAREQVNMIPQQMMDALPGEISKVLMLVDDTMQCVRTLSGALPSAPSITSISPTTLPPSFSTQLFNIYGSNFKPPGDPNSSVLIFRDPANILYVRDPLFISSSRLQHHITVQSAVGSWSVTVTNTGQAASSSTNFLVEAPPPNTGSLTVNLSPLGAAASAQWRVDGGSYRNSGDTVTGLTPGTHTVSFKAISGYSTPADKTASINSGATTTEAGAYIAVGPATYSLGISSDSSRGTVRLSPARQTFAAGETVRLTAVAASGWHFDRWSDDATGTENPKTIVMDSDKHIIANYASGDWSIGGIKVTLQPPGAVAEGARWRANGGDWQFSGFTLGNLDVTDHYLEFGNVSGWTKPASRSVNVIGGQTTNVTVSYVQDSAPGTLFVTLTPPGVVSAEARWRVNGGPAQASGASISLAPGSYAITFDSLAGWIAPGGQTITIRPGQAAVVTGKYAPPAGQPLIVSVRPPIGPLGGGTAITIDGANFVSPVSVLLDGKPATNVTVLSASQIICLTPSNSFYGTVAVVVQTSGGSATNVNAFTYGVPRGSGLQLAGSIGGAVYGVAAQGSHCYFGEGSSLVVLNVATPANPSQVARLTLPGLVRDIAMVSLAGRQYALVAASDAGLQVVDVTIPASPVLRGQYITTDRSLGVAVLGGFAYVAMRNAGLGVFDISSPAKPRLVNSITTGGFADELVIRATANGVFAYVSSGGALQVVDVTNPDNLILRGQSAAVTDWWRPHSLAFAGNRVFIADNWEGLKVIDTSDPDAPTVLSNYNADGFISGVAAVGSRVYLRRDAGGVSVCDVVSGNLQRIGSTSAGPVAKGNNVAVLGGYVFCSGQEYGLSIYDTTSPTAPAYRTTFDATSGDYRSLSLDGTTVYAATQSRGLKVFNSGNPANSTLRSQFLPASGSGQKVETVQNQVFFSGDGYVRILDVSNPDSPVLQGTTSPDLFFIHDFYVRGSYIVTAGNLQTTFKPSVAILNPIPPNAVTIRGFLELDSQNNLARAVTGNSSIACVAVPSSGESCSLRVVNLGNTQMPQQTGQLADIGAVAAMLLAPDNRHLYIANKSIGQRCWRIVDVANAGNPFLVSSNYVGNNVLGFHIQDTTAYVAAAERGVLVYDVSSPTEPVLVRSYDTSGDAYDVKVSDNMLFVADFEGGMVVLEISDIEAPQPLIITPTFWPSYTNSSGTLNVGGGASDNKTVTRVAWSNSRGGGGDADGTESWFVSGIGLQPGTNTLTVTAFDAAGNSGSDMLTVIYQTPKQNQTNTFPAIADHTFGDAPIPLAAAASSGLSVQFDVLSGPATVANNLLTLVGAGTITIRAIQPGDDQFNSAVPVDRTFIAAKADQAITMGAVPDKSMGDAPFTLNAASSSGLPAAFSIVSGPATVIGNTVTLTGAGAVTVRASQPGNSNFNPAPNVERTFTVTGMPQFITFGMLSRQVFGDAPFALAAAASSGLPVSFSVLSGPAIVSGNILTMIGSGLVVLRASQSGDATYAAAPSVDQVLIVAPGNNLITDFQRLTDGRFHLLFAGELEQTYVVEYSTNLMHWTPLVTNRVNTLGYLEFTDLSSTNQPQSFYRVKAQ